MTKVLVLSGRKQSGKTTCRNFLYGYIMRHVGIIDKFAIHKNGDLHVPAEFEREGKKVVDFAHLDVDDTSPQFIDYASQRIWPFIRSYSFADDLKGIAMDVFGLTYDQCYGTNDDKNTVTNILWDNMFFVLTVKQKKDIKADIDSGKRQKFMTAREFLQIFGTEVCRKIYGDCWVDACFRRINLEQPNLAIITDARFPNEIEASLKHGAYVMRFSRAPHKDEDEHESETALDVWDVDPELRAKYSIWCDNKDMDISTQNDFVLNALIEKEVLPKTEE